MEPTFSIAEISKRTGLSYDTIRYYEKIGLLPPAKRKENGQREYDAQNYESCYSVLYEHKLNIESQMAEVHATLGIMNYKL
jgi:DNA-binding transcriptional MerR regulator